ncbi:MAG: VOC family protein [Planctomycetota bacterium]|nr:MAG: VOC family protein [Planctomycetota bacterium]
MTSASTYTPGQFTWNELGTSDLAAAKTFYSKLFGWRLTDEAMGDMGVYTLIWIGEQHIGGMYEQKGPQFEGVPPNWMGYVSVEGADAAAAKASELGGTVCMPPMDIPDVGRMAVLQDPGGATFAVFQELPDKCSSPLPDIAGTFCWNELATRDADAAKAFYNGLFAWEHTGKKMDQCDVEYTQFASSSEPRAGMVPMLGEMWGDTPPHWMTYIRVDDTEAVAKQATELGANICVPPTETPDGTFAVITDPTGAVFSIKSKPAGA